MQLTANQNNTGLYVEKAIQLLSPLQKQAVGPPLLYALPGQTLLVTIQVKSVLSYGMKDNMISYYR